MELETYASEILEKVGVKRGHIVLDFGCRSGMYTIPAAKMVGNEGKVYALDKDGWALDELMQRAKLANLRNIAIMYTYGELEIELADDCIDVVLLFDVFHSDYLPRPQQRRKLLGEVYRILKSNGLFSVYPKHMESEARDEIESANFYLESEFSGIVIHDLKNLEKGEILNFRKKLKIT